MYEVYLICLMLNVTCSSRLHPYSGEQKEKRKEGRKEERERGGGKGGR
jgi:hypothetical protein